MSKAEEWVKARPRNLDVKGFLACVRSDGMIILSKDTITVFEAQELVKWLKEEVL